MAHLHHSLVGLRIFSDTLDPKELSRQLGGVPTRCFRKGDVKRSKHRDIVRKSGAWILNATKREPGDFDAQVEEILGQLTQDLTVWAQLTASYKIDLSCGFFMKETDEGISISQKILKDLSDRGIKLEICIYAPLKDVEANDPCPCGSEKTYSECCGRKRGGDAKGTRDSHA